MELLFPLFLFSLNLKVYCVKYKFTLSLTKADSFFLAREACISSGSDLAIFESEKEYFLAKVKVIHEKRDGKCEK